MTHQSLIKHLSTWVLVKLEPLKDRDYPVQIEVFQGLNNIKLMIQLYFTEKILDMFLEAVKEILLI